jgi:hypothetical protein
MKLIRFICSFSKFYGSWIRIQEIKINQCGAGTSSGFKTLLTGESELLALMQKGCHPYWRKKWTRPKKARLFYTDP